MFLFWAAVAAAAPCPATTATVTAAVADAERAFADLDATGLGASLDAAVEGLACTDAPVPPVLAARLHRAQALRAFVAGDEAAARRALYAARVLDPVGDYPVGVVPADHPLRGLMANAVFGALPSVTVPAPPAGTVHFDGRATLERPSDRPTVYQLAGPSGVTAGGWLAPETAFPAWSTPAAAPVAPKPAKTSWILAGAGVASLVAGGITYGLAGASNAAFWDPATPDAEVPALYERTNTLVYLSAGLAGVGLAGGVGAVVAGQW